MAYVYVETYTFFKALSKTKFKFFRLYSYPISTIFYLVNLTYVFLASIILDLDSYSLIIVIISDNIF